MEHRPVRRVGRGTARSHRRPPQWCSPQPRAAEGVDVGGNRNAGGGAGLAPRDGGCGKRPGQAVNCCPTRTWMSRFFSGLLFWTMALAGGLTLIPCLILPPWIEYRAALAGYAAAERRVGELERRYVANERKIDHQQNDLAYIEREARR